VTETPIASRGEELLCELLLLPLRFDRCYPAMEQLLLDAIGVILSKPT
jgi:hypothetical protein